MLTFLTMLRSVWEENKVCQQNDEHSSWCSRVDGIWCRFEIGEKKFCEVMDQHAWPNRTTPIQSTQSMTMSAMVVECE